MCLGDWKEGCGTGMERERLPFAHSSGIWGHGTSISSRPHAGLMPTPAHMGTLPLRESP